MTGPANRCISPPRLPSRRLVAVPVAHRATDNQKRSTARLYAQSQLPTDVGDFDVRVYRYGDGEEALVLSMGPMPPTGPVLARVHSECLTSEVFGSLRCDCRQQLEQALARIAETGAGLVVYLRQEGRGIGLGNKIRAYGLQDRGADTVAANHQLGFATDLRGFDIAADILMALGVDGVRLHTNNPDKVHALERAGIAVEQVPAFTSVNRHNRAYLETKQRQLGHDLGAMLSAPAQPHPLTADHAWLLLRRLAERASAGRPVDREVGLRLDSAGQIEEVDGEHAWLLVRPDRPTGWSWSAADPAGSAADPVGVAADTVALLDLYMPLCIGARAGHMVVGHLGQTLDGRIATRSGDSQFITGRENLEHMHRMRALFDAVVVGAETVALDNPSLTTRLVPGNHATRVIVDPSQRTPIERNVYRDGLAETLLLCAQDGRETAVSRHGNADVVRVPKRAGTLPVEAILDALRARGLRRIFVEGGGRTVSRFVSAQAFDQLHIAVAPMIFGSGRDGLSLPPIDRLAEARLLHCRHFTSGDDILFVCTLEP